MTPRPDDDPDRATVDPDAPTPAELAARAHDARTPAHRSRRITIGRVIGCAVAGVLLAAVLWFCGIDTGFAAAAGALLALIGVAWAAYSDGASAVWPREKPQPRPGARTDVSSLAWAFRPHRGAVREQGFSAVRKLAAGRLTRLGLDLAEERDRDAISTLIGASALATLTPRGGALPSPAAVDRCLDALDSLLADRAFAGLVPPGAAASGPVPTEPPAAAKGRRTR
jgi:hypothetical protein